MSELAPIAFILVFAAVVGLPCWLVVRALRRNRALRGGTGSGSSRELARLAAERGWRYVPRDSDFLKRFTGYPFGRGGRAQPVFDLVTGTHRGRPFACFQYSRPRSLPPGEHPIEINYARVFAVSLDTPVPTVLVTAARAAPRWTRRFTTDDDTFDRMFAVGTEDERFASAVLTPQVRRWLVDNPTAVTLRLGGPDLIGWHAERKEFDARTVVPVLDYLYGFLDQIPAAALP
jgi:hypothetical protein